MKRRILLTVDVEALPKRATRDHVARLVYGRFAGHPPMGLREMMSEAEKYSARLTCFFDYCEVDLYGDGFLDVAREIVDRGHDLQLHAHAELMKPETWKRLGLARPVGTLDTFSEAEADRLFDWLLELHGRVCSRAPVAFRGGGYRYSANVLAAMQRHGVTVSSNHNPGRANQLDSRDSCAFFHHGNGVLEVPISVLHKGQARVEFNFNQHGFSGTVGWFPEAFWNRYGERSVLNLVTHSRSFLVLDEKKQYYMHKGEEPLLLYRSLLARLQDWKAEAVGIAQFVDDMQKSTSANAVGPEAATGCGTHSPATDAPVPAPAAKSARPASPPPVLAPKLGAIDSRPRSLCPVCSDAARQFVDFNGRKLARCGACGALERQRSLIDAWNASLRHDVPTEGRAALMVSPAKSERAIVNALGFSSVRTLDIRPEARCDIVADLCSMPQVADASFDLVFASHVLPHVHDLDAALAEIARILTPDGVFLSFTPTQVGRPTTVAADAADASAWYGADALKKHQVGSFRSFGDLGLLRDLQRHFIVKSAMGQDTVTGRMFMWVCGWKHSAADQIRRLPKEGRRYSRS